MMQVREFFRARKPVVASILMPTFGEARFARWAVESVRRQTIENIELFIICDGSPAPMVSFFEELAAEDSRIRVYCFQKSERTGEPYRDTIIKTKARGRYIFYCSHDDLWFPNHIKALCDLMRHKVFVHSLHVSVKESEFQEDAFISRIIYADLAVGTYREKMQNTAVQKNFFGLTYGAHTFKAYRRLKEGWTTTPPGVWTDLHMWRKLLEGFPSGCGTCKKVTALNFPAYCRSGWSAQKREEELAFYFKKIREPDFIEKVNEMARQIVTEAVLKNNRLNGGSIVGVG
jgi:glycosyltransferase involved in cell wall biosynthesis